MRVILTALIAPLLLASPVWAADSVPTEVQQPGTQPGDGLGSLDPPSNCDNCHDNILDQGHEPILTWRGGMMANALRDGLFWATLAIAEQDFLPGTDPDLRGGVGDLCLRCHGPDGWLGGRSTPTDGRDYRAQESDGVECAACHLLLDPDPATNIATTEELQFPPFTAWQEGTGEAYHGSGMYVLNGTSVRLGPYQDHLAPHQALQSAFHREGDMCGTCHDVSNPVVGDLAPNNGALTPLDPSTFSGVLGAAVTQKAAFNNPPYAYGVAERTFSEWKASGLDDFPVNDYPTLPADLRTAGGALDNAYVAAWTARSDADYEDGTLRTFTCQTCHMPATSAVGCSQISLVRTDLPLHDQTGGSYWAPDMVLWQEDHGTLQLGSGLSADQRAALQASKGRAQAQLTSAAGLSAVQDGADLVVRVTNLTGHKLISGYPEGRRMWLNVRWLDGDGQLVAESGAYGTLGRGQVQDLQGVGHDVQSLLDPSTTVLYWVDPGMDQAWAQALLDLDYDPDLALAYDRMDDSVTLTLGQLAGQAPDSAAHTFHFALNNVILEDTRIPPYRFDHDQALVRNALPVPPTQFGDPGPGGEYDHWHEARLEVPEGAVSAEVRLHYQQTSWEYVQFLWLANDGLNPTLGDEGLNLLDAWLNTGMSTPFEMAFTDAPVAYGPLFSDDFEGGDTTAWSGLGP